MLLMTENSFDLEIRVPYESRTVKIIERYASEFFVYHFLLVVNCTRGRILYRL